MQKETTDDKELSLGSFITLTIVFLSLTCLIGNLWIGSIIKEYRLNKHGSVTTGTVTDYWKDIEKKHDRVTGTTYEEVRGEYVYVDYLNISKKFQVYKQYAKNDEVLIMYLPSNPDYAMIGNPENSLGDILGLSSFSGIIANLFYFLGFILCGALFLLSVYALRIRWRKSKESGGN